VTQKKSNISKYLDYRLLIRELSEEKGVSQRSLAESASVHASYFSRVMAGKADFSHDQLFSIGKDLGLVSWELSYLLLLGEHASAGTAQLKGFLRARIQKIQEERQKIFRDQSGVEMLREQERIESYYADPLTAKVHICLTIKRFREKPLLIAGRLNVSEARIHSELEKLGKLGIIERDHRGAVTGVKFNIHLDENHPLSAQNHANWRLESIRKIQEREKKPSDYHFSAVFSTDTEAKLKIKDMFKAFVLAAQSEASEQRANEDLCVISFDLF